MKTNLDRRQFVGGALGLAGAGVALASRGAAAEAPANKAGLVNPRDFGATADGSHLDTQALQRAIDACAGNGGGTVYVPPGTYPTGTLFLKSRVTLHLEAGATLLGSPNLADYPVTIPALRSYTDNYTERCLIYGEGLQQVALHGRGVIDGQGAAFKGPYKVRPYLIRLVSCQDVSVRDLTLRDSPMWVQQYLACDGVLVDGLRVLSRCNSNNDGLDVDACQRVRISNCDISSGDDAIVLKSTLDRPCRDVVITNCLLSSACNAFKLGTESNGGFINVALSNCSLYDTDLAGLALELVDGGQLERVSISNVVMRNVNGPIFIRLGNRARPFKDGMAKPAQGSLHGISISHVQATGANRIGCSITGLPGALADNISLEDISIAFAGGGKADDAQRSIAELPDRYPEYAMFGALPAYGFYCRHARGLRFSGVRLDCAEPDHRPALVCDDVRDLELLGWRPLAASPDSPVLRLRNVRDALLQGCYCPPGATTFLRVEGKDSERIRLLGADLAGMQQPVEYAADAPPTAVVRLRD